jgi:hypothetical protein
MYLYLCDSTPRGRQLCIFPTWKFTMTKAMICSMKIISTQMILKIYRTFRHIITMIDDVGKLIKLVSYIYLYVYNVQKRFIASRSKWASCFIYNNQTFTYICTYMEGWPLIPTNTDLNNKHYHHFVGEFQIWIHLAITRRLKKRNNNVLPP